MKLKTITRLESPEEVGALVNGDIIEARMKDGYSGRLICVGDSTGSDTYCKWIMRPDRSRVYLLHNRNVEVEGDKIIQSGFAMTKKEMFVKKLLNNLEVELLI